MSRLLIVGVPRSGTTWIGQTLGHTEGAVYVNEPDGDHDPFAFRARRGHLIAPALAPGDAAPDYARLWAGAFAGGRPPRALRARVARRLYASTPLADRWEAWLGGPVSVRLRLAAALALPREAIPEAEHVVVKSVRSELSVEWIAARFSPTVLVVERNPLNVLSSWVELGYVRDPREAAAVGAHARTRWGIDPPGAGEPALVHQAFTYATLTAALRDAALHHADWITAYHEDLCTDSVARFRELAARLGLGWGDTAEEFLADSNREGSGYRTQRRTEDQPDRWRERLAPEQVETIRATLARFPHDLLREP